MTWYATECANCGRQTHLERDSPRDLTGLCLRCYREMLNRMAHEAALAEQRRRDEERARPLPRRRQARYLERLRRLGGDQVDLIAGGWIDATS